METTKLSTRGQVVIPSGLRASYRWNTGQVLDVIDTGDGILLKARAAQPTGAWAEVAGCLHRLSHGKPPVTDDQIQNAVRDMARARYLHGTKE